MKKYIGTVITALTCITLAVLGFVFNGFNLSSNQLDTLLILGIICGSSVLYCFIVGEISRNNSQMDKLWSLLPIAYAWVVTVKGGFHPRLIVMAVLITLWGIRLTFNFARKGAYSIKFWTGEEDYRWVILRENKMFKGHYVRWALFNLFFISLFQNALVLAMTFPMVAVMDSGVSFGVFDYIASSLVFILLLIELIADEQQWKFQQTKKKLLKEGKKLDELELPYKRGFNTVGLWSYSRHPNYCGEQGFWLALFLFTLGANVNTYFIFNWSMFGALFIVILFLGSSMFGEGISNSKYPEYKYYLCYVSKYIPFRKYNPEKAKAKYEKNHHE